MIISASFDENSRGRAIGMVRFSCAMTTAPRPSDRRLAHRTRILAVQVLSTRRSPPHTRRRSRYVLKAEGHAGPSRSVRRVACYAQSRRYGHRASGIFNSVAESSRADGLARGRILLTAFLLGRGSDRLLDGPLHHSTPLFSVRTSRHYLDALIDFFSLVPIVLMQADHYRPHLQESDAARDRTACSHTVALVGVASR